MRRVRHNRRHTLTEHACFVTAIAWCVCLQGQRVVQSVCVCVCCVCILQALDSTLAIKRCVRYGGVESQPFPLLVDCIHCGMVQFAGG